MKRPTATVTRQLIFKATDVRRVVEHSLAAPKQGFSAYTTTPVSAPAVVLVHDDGVYLMSNGEPADMIAPGHRFVAYAAGCDPRRDADHWETSRDLVGGDDFAETLPWAKPIKVLLDRGVITIAILIGADSLELRA